MRLMPPSITNVSLLPVVLYLLGMHHHPRELYVIVEHRIPTLLLQISIDFFDEPAHLIPVVRYKGSSIPGQLNKLREYYWIVMNTYLMLINSSTLSSLISL